MTAEENFEKNRWVRTRISQEISYHGGSSFRLFGEKKKYHQICSVPLWKLNSLSENSKNFPGVHQSGWKFQKGETIEMEIFYFRDNIRSIFGFSVILEDGSIWILKFPGDLLSYSNSSTKEFGPIENIPLKSQPWSCVKWVIKPENSGKILGLEILCDFEDQKNQHRTEEESEFSRNIQRTQQYFGLTLGLLRFDVFNPTSTGKQITPFQLGISHEMQWDMDSLVYVKDKTIPSVGDVYNIALSFDTASWDSIRYIDIFLKKTNKWIGRSYSNYYVISKFHPKVWVEDSTIPGKFVVELQLHPTFRNFESGSYYPYLLSCNKQ